MKRILVLALALIVAVGFLAVPSYAAEFDNNYWMNVLDYSTANDSGGNYFTCNTSGSAVYYVPSGTAINYIDMLLKIAGGAPSSVTISSVAGSNVAELTVLSMGNGMYRVFGDTGNRVVSAFKLNFTFAEDVKHYITFLSLTAGIGDRYFVPAVGMMSGNVAGGSIRLIYDPESTEICGTSVVVDMNDDITDYLLYLECSDWQKFDYIDYQIYLTEVSSLDGITATFGDLTLPIAVSYVGQSYENAFYVSIRVDLTGIDRTASKDYYPMVMISGVCNYDLNFFALMSVTGIYKVDQVPWYLYLYSKWQSASSGWWEGLDSALSSWRTAWDSWSSDLSSFFADWKTSWAEVMVSIYNYFQSVLDSLSSGFELLAFALQSIYDSFIDFVTDVKDFWSSLFDSLDAIYQALTATGDSEDFADDVGQQGDKLDDMAGIMDSVTQPDIDSIDTDLSGIVADADLTNVANVYTSVIGDGFMLQILTMVSVMAMMSYALFGKR